MKLKILILAFILLSGFYTRGQQENYYVVIGGFTIEANAQKLIDKAHSLSVPAYYSFNDARKLFYVFVRATESKGDAYETLGSIQAEGFSDAWVYKGMLSGGLTPQRPESSGSILVSMRADSPTTDSPLVGSENVSTSSQVDAAPLTEEPTQQEIISPIATSEQNSEVTASITPVGKPFLFKILNGSTGSPISGQVQLLESEKANQYRGFKANEKVYVVPPKNRGGKWYIVCSVVGFQTYKKSFIYSSPEQFDGAVVGNDQEYVIPLTLSRVKKGDYIELDGTKFFENSNVLTPQSQGELSELEVMMQENPAYKIRLHGHTNGDHNRNVIAREGDQDFFSLGPTNKRFDGSAKVLSALRAETIKNYLVSRGIDGARIAVKGEGGKQPIFDPKGASAASNARVEVEITRH
jgi:outer membrane protein OmpA-like peptidoglycan-associated protein